MSAATLPPPPPAPAQPTLDLTGTTPISFGQLCRVELRKSYNTRAGMWFLIAIGSIIALVDAIVLVVGLVNSYSMSFDDNIYIAGTITILLLPVLAIMLVTSEWTQRSAMVSFTLEPRRMRVILAKLVVSVAFVLATLVVMLATSAVVTGISEIAQPDLTTWEFEPQVLLGFLIFQAITMAIGFAFGSLLLNTPAAIVLFFVYWYLLPGLVAWAGTISEGLDNALEWVNFQVAVSPLTEWEMDTGDEWGKLIVSSLLWVVLPLGLGITRILRAEVK